MFNGLVRGVKLIWLLVRLLLVELRASFADQRPTSKLQELVAIAEIWIAECQDARGKFKLKAWDLLRDPFKGSRRAFENYRQLHGIKEDV